jgi:lipoprotein signal peptidase
MLNRLINAIRPINFMWLGLSVFAILLDQWTKNLASTHLVYGEAKPVVPYLDWTLLHNHGAAFSFLSDAGGWQRYLFTVLAAVVSVIYRLVVAFAEAFIDSCCRYCIGFRRCGR